MIKNARRAILVSIPAVCFALVGLVASTARAQSSPQPSEPFAESAAGSGENPPPTAEPRADPARWQIGARLSGSAYSIQDGGAASSAPPLHGNAGSVGVAPLVFLSPVVDDDAPHSMQPFLQGTSTIGGSVSGGGFSTRASDGTTRDFAWMQLGAGADVYVTRHFALTGGGGYGYEVLEDEQIDKTHVCFGSAGFGVRFGDVRFDAAYAVAARNTNGSFPDQRWGVISLDVDAAIRRSVLLALSGHVRDGGGGAGVEVDVYPMKPFGVFFGGSGETFLFSSSESRANDFGGFAGLSYWVTPGARLQWSYELTFRHSPALPPSFEYDQVTHAITFGLLFRPR